MINDFLFVKGFTFFPYDLCQDDVGRKMKFNYKLKFILVVENQHFKRLYYYLNILSVLDIIRKIIKTCFTLESY